MFPILSQKFAEDVCDIALQAGEAIRAIAQAPFAIDKKADRSPVTAADRAANDLIVAALQRLTPDHVIVSEEGEQTLENPDQPFWLVDPLDGTKEFLAGNGEYTVNIALIDRHQPVMGVVHAPAKKQTYLSFGPGKAFQVTGGKALNPIAVRQRPNAIVALASRSHLDDKTTAYLDERHIADVRRMGSSLKFCIIAAGEADLYPRFGPTMEWDTAAGHAILLAAGGNVMTTDGKPLRYGKPGFRNPDFIAGSY